MAGTGQTAEIRINRCTIWIADQLYQISTIASVDVIAYKLDQGEGTYGGVNGLRRRLLATGLAWLIALYLILGVADGGPTGAVSATIVCAAIAGRYLYFLVRIATNKSRHALLLYCGNRVTVISSTDRNVLIEMQWLIGDAIENPPQHEIRRTLAVQNLTIGDHVAGDKIEQHGSGSQGKVFNG